MSRWAGDTVHPQPTGPWGHGTVEVDVPRRSAPAAALEALAESGPIFLPLKLASVQALGATTGPLAVYPAFVVIFVAGTMVATRFHRSRWMPSAAALGGVALGLVQGIWLSPRSVPMLLLAVTLSLVVALRAVTLAFRDWRNPVQESFGVVSVLLLAEIIMASSANAGWEPLLVVIVPLFFAGSLVSRAMSVRLAAEGRPGTEGTSIASEAPPPRMFFGVVAGLLLVVAVGALLGAQGGVLEWIGRLAFLAITAVIVAISLVLGLIAQGIASILGAFHVDIARALQSLAGKIGRARAPLRGPAGPTHLSWLDRTAGLLVLVAAVALVTWLIHRRRERPAWFHKQRAGAAEVRGAVTRSPLPQVPPRRPVRKLPADAVRRWYAEALLILEGRGVVRPPAATPGEYVRPVGAAFPESQPGFDALTDAYEQVRYGARSLDASELAGIETARDAAMSAIRTAPRADQAEEVEEMEGRPVDEPRDARRTARLPKTWRGRSRS